MLRLIVLLSWSQWKENTAGYTLAGIFHKEGKKRNKTERG